MNMFRLSLFAGVLTIGCLGFSSSEASAQGFSFGYARPRVSVGLGTGGVGYYGSGYYGGGLYGNGLYGGYPVVAPSGVVVAPSPVFVPRPLFVPRTYVVPGPYYGGSYGYRPYRRFYRRW
jgi:hypothetical protein